MKEKRAKLTILLSLYEDDDFKDEIIYDEFVEIRNITTKTVKLDK